MKIVSYYYFNFIYFFFKVCALFEFVFIIICLIYCVPDMMIFYLKKIERVSILIRFVDCKFHKLTNIDNNNNNYNKNENERIISE